MILRIFFLLVFFLPRVALAGFPAEDEAFLEEVQERSFRYFEEQVNPYNGLVPDSAPHQGHLKSRVPASIAAVGFALTAYPVGVERGWMERGKALELTRRTLEFFLNHADQERDFYHFLIWKLGSARENPNCPRLIRRFSLRGPFLPRSITGIRDSVIWRKVFTSESISRG